MHDEVEKICWGAVHVVGGVLGDYIHDSKFFFNQQKI
jgi:hypothetical protein